MTVKLVRDDTAELEEEAPGVLLVAEHVLIAALLGALVELAEYRPCFPRPGERPADAIHRLAPAIVLTDARLDGPCLEEVDRIAIERGSALVLFGHRTEVLRVTARAARRRARVLTLPVESRTLEAILDAETGRGGARRG